MKEIKDDIEKLSRSVYELTGHLQSFYDLHASIKEMIKENNIKDINCPEFLQFLKMAFTAGFVQCAVDTKGIITDEEEVEHERN